MATPPWFKLNIRPPVAKLIQKLDQGNIELPVLDPRAAQIQALTRQPECSIDDVVQAVEGDVTLSGSVLRVANSSYYMRRMEVRTLREACVRLGIKRVSSIVLELLFKDHFIMSREPFRTILDDMWKNVFVTARMCDRLCVLMKRADAEEMYLVALMHNMGEMLAIQMLADLQRPPVSDEEYLLAVAADVEQIHERLGQLLGAAWNLPEDIVRLAGRHHAPESAPEPEDHFMMRHLVLAAWTMTLTCGYTYLPGQERDGPEPHLEELGLSDLDELYEEAGNWGVEGREDLL